MPRVPQEKPANSDKFHFKYLCTYCTVLIMYISYRPKFHSYTQISSPQYEKVGGKVFFFFLNDAETALYLQDFCKKNNLPSLHQGLMLLLLGNLGENSKLIVRT